MSNRKTDSEDEDTATSNVILFLNQMILPKGTDRVRIPQYLMPLYTSWPAPATIRHSERRDTRSILSVLIIPTNSEPLTPKNTTVGMGTVSFNLGNRGYIHFSF
jgi:hypothetical protein